MGLHSEGKVGRLHPLTFKQVKPSCNPVGPVLFREGGLGPGGEHIGVFGVFDGHAGRGCATYMGRVQGAILLF